MLLCHLGYDLPISTVIDVILDMTKVCWNHDVTNTAASFPFEIYRCLTRPQRRGIRLLVDG